MQEYLPADLVLMDASKEPQDGDIFAAWIDGEGGTLKEFEREKDQIWLKPLNKPEYHGQVYHVHRVLIQGVRWIR